MLHEHTVFTAVAAGDKECEVPFELECPVYGEMKDYEVRPMKVFGWGSGRGEPLS